MSCRPPEVTLPRLQDLTLNSHMTRYGVLSSLLNVYFLRQFFLDVQRNRVFRSSQFPTSSFTLSRPSFFLFDLMTSVSTGSLVLSESRDQKTQSFFSVVLMIMNDLWHHGNSTSLDNRVQSQYNIKNDKGSPPFKSLKKEESGLSP